MALAITLMLGDIVEECKVGNLLHGVNKQGVMGVGVAKQIRDKYPSTYKAYKAYCLRYYKSIELGDLFMHRVGDLRIINGFTQERYGKDGLEGMAYTNQGIVDAVIRRSLEAFKGEVINTVPIGGGYGGIGLEGFVGALERAKDVDGEIVIWVNKEREYLQLKRLLEQAKLLKQ